MPHLFEVADEIYMINGKLDEAKSRIREEKCSAEVVIQKQHRVLPRKGTLDFLHLTKQTKLRPQISGSHNL